MIKEMAMKYGHAPNHRVCKIHNHINVATIGHVHSFQPLGVRQPYAVFRIGKEMHLVNVERMKLCGVVYDAPMLIRSDAGSRHGSCFGGVLLPVDVKAV